MAKAAIVVIATLDTKGPETAFVVGRVEACGYRALVMDTGITPNQEPTAPVPSITSDDIAAEVGESRKHLASRMSEQDTRDRWIRCMAAGSASVLKKLHAEGRVAGVVGLGGAQGTEVCSTAMRALPIGVPKMLVSTVASGRTPFGIYTGTRDLTIMHSVVDILGLNALTRARAGQRRRCGRRHGLGPGVIAARTAVAGQGGHFDLRQYNARGHGGQGEARATGV